MIWAPFLHIYQPPTQLRRVLINITIDSYIKLVEILTTNPKAALTLNICASLTEQLAAFFPQIIEKIAKLAKAGQIEFTGSASYHPLLSKLPRGEIIRQIELNSEINRKYFGKVFAPVGFFPPEMAYSPLVGDILEELGFSWVILEEFAYGGKYISRNKIYKRAGKKLLVFFRERDLSLKIAFSEINSIPKLEKYLGSDIHQPGYLITAMDGETFGHHRPGLELFLAALYKFGKLPSIKISELIEKFPTIEETEPIPSTWAISEDDCRKGIVYPRWDLRDNPLHRLQWKLTDLAIKSVNSPSAARSGPGGKQKTVKSKQFIKARNLLDKALHSDQYWWASHNPFWHYKMMVRGANMLAQVVKESPLLLAKDKSQAQQLRQEIASLGLKLYGDTIIDH